MTVNLVQLDDVIGRTYQDRIQTETGLMPWFFQEESGRRTEVAASYSGFSNTVFHINDQSGGLPQLTALLLPLLLLFCDKASTPFQTLLRIRIGLFPRTMIDVPHHNPHVDFYQAHHNALYYVNDSDGDTVVFNETFHDVGMEQSAQYTREGRFTVAHRVSPQKGRMVGFNGSHYHASMHPMKHSARIAIAFSYL
jgi:hypothetical protein